jgi:CRISPR/Cas system-associated protein Cas5 (RAMP superfamily)
MLYTIHNADVASSLGSIEGREREKEKRTIVTWGHKVEMKKKKSRVRHKSIEQNRERRRKKSINRYRAQKRQGRDGQNPNVAQTKNRRGHTNAKDCMLEEG